MKYKTKEDVMNRVKEHYNWAVAEFGENRVVMVSLQGSQNYGKGMSDENSDVDTKCMVLPTLEELMKFKKEPNFTKVFENEEHCDVKLHSEYFKLTLKQNTNFLEMFFTEYAVVNPKYLEEVELLREKAEDLSHYDMKRHLKTLLGMAYQKEAALTKRFESKKELVDTFGFDGKQLAHLYRLNDFMKFYLEGVSYKECLTKRSTTNMANKMLNLKRHTHNLPVAEAEAEAARLVANMKEMERKALEEKTFTTKDELFDWLKDLAVTMVNKSLKR